MKATDYDPIPSAFVEGENYVVFRNVVAVGGTIAGAMQGAPTAGPEGNPEGEGDFNGFTIVLIPEPATLSLLAIGGLVLMRRRRT